MRNLIAVLSCGASLGLAFTPSNVLPIGGDKCRITTAASVAFDATCRHRRLTAAGSTRRFLFSPEHGDHDGGVVLARPNKKSGAKSGGGGGWGSWAKVVSQRKEQEQVLKKFAKEEGGGLGAEFNNLRVRTGQKGDMLGVSQLCVDTFRGPFEWYMLPLQLFQVWPASGLMGYTFLCYHGCCFVEKETGLTTCFNLVGIPFLKQNAALHRIAS